MKKIIAIIVCFVIISMPAYAAADLNKESDMKTLFVKNGILTDGENEVILNGVNLGGWLIMESWMGIFSVNGEPAYLEIIATLNKRFGEDKAKKIIKAYEDNYITEYDFDNIKALGFNCIRVPFWYRNFMNEDGTWLTESLDKNPGFKRLDWVVEKCSERNIYVILDMHGCPGGQSMNHSCGVRGKNSLYNNEGNLSAMEKLWKAIARRYKDEPCVAAYDIMNEPQNNGGYKGENAWEAESPEAVAHTNSVYDRMIKAIRKIDKTHIISLEGVWSINTLPNPKRFGYTNMMYQLHLYDDAEAMLEYRIDELLTAQSEWGTAVLVGEYNNKAIQKYATDRYKESGIGYIKWTYKTVGVGYDNWGLYNKNMNKADIEKASYDEIMNICNNELHTGNGYEFNTEEFDRIK